MSMIRVYAAVCPYCGYDVAKVRQVIACFEVYCDTEGSGCGECGPLVSNEALAVAGWNAKCYVRVKRAAAVQVGQKTLRNQRFANGEKSPWAGI